MELIALRPDEANCSMCRRGPQGANDCPLKGRVQNVYLKLERHDCSMFKHFSKAQIEKRLGKDKRAPLPAEQGSLF